MTALKPAETHDVKGVPSTKYPTNRQCGHPHCTEPAQSVHHCFPRSQIGNGSYFVSINGEKPIPHAIGLCGSGTTGHHGDLEEHRSWIKLEEDGFVWYDRVAPTDPHDEIPEDWQGWHRVGILNPQPGSVEGKPKRRRTQKGTAERASRKTISVRLPEDFGGDDWDELIEEAERVELSQPDTPFDPSRGAIAVGKLLVNTLERFVGRAG